MWLERNNNNNNSNSHNPSSHDHSNSPPIVRATSNINSQVATFVNHPGAAGRSSNHDDDIILEHNDKSSNSRYITASASTLDHGSSSHQPNAMAPSSKERILYPNGSAPASTTEEDYGDDEFENESSYRHVYGSSQNRSHQSPDRLHTPRGVVEHHSQRSASAASALHPHSDQHSAIEHSSAHSQPYIYPGPAEIAHTDKYSGSVSLRKSQSATSVKYGNKNLSPLKKVGKTRGAPLFPRQAFPGAHSHSNKPGITTTGDIPPDSLSIRDDLMAAKKQIHNYQNEVTTLRGQVSRLEGQIKRKDKNIQHILSFQADTSGDPTGQFAVFKSEKLLITSLLDKVKALENEIISKENVLTSTEQQNHQTYSKLLETQTIVHTQETEIQRLNALVEKMKSMHLHSNHLVLPGQQAIIQPKLSLQEEKQQMNELERALDEIEIQRQAKKHAQSECAKLTAQLSEKSKVDNDLMIQLRRNRELLRHKVEQLEEVMGKYREQCTANEKLQFDIVNLQNECDAAKKQSLSHIRSKTNITKEFTTLQSENNNLRLQLTAIERELDKEKLKNQKIMNMLTHRQALEQSSANPNYTAETTLLSNLSKTKTEMLTLENERLEKQLKQLQQEKQSQINSHQHKPTKIPSTKKKEEKPAAAATSTTAAAAPTSSSSSTSTAIPQSSSVKKTISTSRSSSQKSSNNNSSAAASGTSAAPTSSQPTRKLKANTARSARKDDPIAEESSLKSVDELKSPPKSVLSHVKQQAEHKKKQNAAASNKAATSRDNKKANANSIAEEVEAPPTEPVIPEPVPVNVTPKVGAQPVPVESTPEPTPIITTQPISPPPAAAPTAAVENGNTTIPHSAGHGSGFKTSPAKEEKSPEQPKPAKSPQLTAAATPAPPVPAPVQVQETAPPKTAASEEEYSYEYDGFDSASPNATARTAAAAASPKANIEMKAIDSPAPPTATSGDTEYEEYEEYEYVEESASSDDDEHKKRKKHKKHKKDKKKKKKSKSRENRDRGSDEFGSSFDGDTKSNDTSAPPTANATARTDANIDPFNRDPFDSNFDDAERQIMIKTGRGYTMAEIRAATKKDNCLTVINGVVYQLKSFLQSHPGGETVLMNNVLGKDATAIFQTVHGDNERAQTVLSQLPQVGRLVNKSAQNNTSSNNQANAALDSILDKFDS